MKLLFDQNLSHHLLEQFAEEFPASTHVRLIGMAQSTDIEIWEYAIANGYCIVTKDTDFIERSRLYGAPPKVIRLCSGNTSPSETVSLLRRNLDLIAELERNPDLHFAEIS